MGVLHYNITTLQHYNADEVWKRCYKTNIQICWISVLVDLKDNEIVLQSIRLAFALNQTLFKLKNANKIIFVFFLYSHLVNFDAHPNYDIIEHLCLFSYRDSFLQVPL